MNPGLPLNHFFGYLVAGLSAGLLFYSLLDIVLRYMLKSKRVQKSELIPVEKSYKQIKISTMVLSILLLIGILLLDFMKYFLLIAGVIYWLFKKVVPQWQNKRAFVKKVKSMKELFPQSVGMMIQALKTGQTVPQVLEYLSKECPSPLKEEYTSIGAEVRLGSSTEKALEKMALRFPDFQEFHQFLESYKISRQTGANLTHLLEVLLEGMEEKGRLMRKMEAMTSQARLSGTMMGILPVLLGMVFFVMDPSLMTPLFTQPAGWGILVLATILETIGFLWIRRLLQLEY